MEEPKLECVHVCHGLLLADLYKSKLQAAGIPVLLRYEAIGPVFGITVDGLGEVRLMVPAEYAVEARTLLQESADQVDEGAEEDLDHGPSEETDETLFAS